MHFSKFGLYTIEVIFLKCPILIHFLFWSVRNVKVDLMVNEITATLSAQFALKKRHNASLKDISIVLNNQRRQG